MTTTDAEPGSSQRKELLVLLQDRFEQNMHRHPGLVWSEVLARLESSPVRLWSLNEMERTGGEPDVIRRDASTGAYVFVDCSAESPGGRRSVCYDREARESRKKHSPATSAVEMAAAMGVVLLTETEYRSLQELGECDTRTSSWLDTPPDIRMLGGAIFGDHRFGQTWVYHNGAESYYAARGFRCSLSV
jgi:hypothetical protein